MACKESEILKRVQLKASKLGWRLWRNNIGLAWTGTPYKTADPQTILLKNARRIRFGLCPGSSDLIGFRLITITADMVGSIFARFAAREVKTPTGRVDSKQQAFLNMVNEAGGDSNVIRHEDEL